MRRLRPLAAAMVLGLAILTVATMYVEHWFYPMPVSHFVIVPIAVALISVAWFAELAGVRWPVFLFALVATAPNLWLAVAGHSLINLLFQVLLAGWIGSWETRRGWSLAALAVAMLPVVTAAGVDASDGQIAVTPWISWGVGLVAVWFLGRALQAQQQLVAQLRQAQVTLDRQSRESERMRLAQEMHDSATQSIYSARMYTEAALRLLGAGDTAKATEHVREVRDAVRDALAGLRLLIHDMRPSVLEQQGLEAALRMRLEGVESRAGISVDFRVDPEVLERLPVEVEHELYRLAQECLNNTLKHAHASRVSVVLRQEPDRVLLEVADDGIGFDAAAVNGAGMGLSSMRERAKRVAGTLEVDSAPGRGTRITVEVQR